MSRLTLSPEALQRLDEVLAQPRGHRLGLLGFGVAGAAMAKFAEQRGFDLVIVDRREDVSLGGVRGELRRGRVDAFDDCDALVVSPGADPRQEMVQRVLKRGAPVLGELELAGELPGRTIAITGTNGKSTTTAWAGHIASAAGQRTFVGGNLGVPFIAWAEVVSEPEIMVLELSSFQLETAHRARFDVSAVLNVTPDHGERYDTFAEYALAKCRLVEGASASDVVVLNANDPQTRNMSERTDGVVWWFSADEGPLPGPHGVRVEGTVIRAHGDAAALDGLDVQNRRLLGRHNVENGLAALACTCAAGVRDFGGYADFAGLEDRLELVAELDGVRYVNDSKATNDEAAATAVRAMERPVILLAGGVDKGGGYSALAAAAKGRVTRALCYGEAREALIASLGSVAASEPMNGFTDAFARAASVARPGDVVLLAPACSSFDEFANYRARGEAFRAAVRALGGDR